MVWAGGFPSPFSFGVLSGIILLRMIPKKVNQDD